MRLPERSRKAIAKYLLKRGFKKAMSMDSFPGVDGYRHTNAEEDDRATITLGVLNPCDEEGFSCCVQLEADVGKMGDCSSNIEIWLDTPTKKELCYLLADLWRLYFFHMGMRFHVLYHYTYHKRHWKKDAPHYLRINR